VTRPLLNVGSSALIRAVGIVSLAIAGLGLTQACLGQTSVGADPKQLLAAAERLADLYNWYDAQPLYAGAEKGFALLGDDRNAMFARVSRLRGEMQIRAFSTLVNDVDSILETDVAKRDKALQLRCLIVRGDVDLEIDTPAAQEDWAAALSVASDLGDRKWQSRARGELGMIAFILGDTGTALSQVTQALVTANATGDIGAQIRYYSAIATGLHLSAEYEQAIKYFDLALGIASKHPETGFQYISIWGKASALLQLGRVDEADRLIQEALGQAEADDRRVKKVQLLIAAADIASVRGQTEKALEYLEEALPIAERGDFRRLLAAIYTHLTELNLRRNEIPEASRYAATALKLEVEAGDRYFLPNQFLALAKVRRAEGNLPSALECLDHATDIIDGLLANVSSASRASMLIHEMSSIYAYQFALAAESGAGAEYAFRVIERARGRVLSEMIPLGTSARSAPPSPERRRLEKEVNRLQRLLLTLDKPAQREATLRNIWETQQAMVSTEPESAHWTPERRRRLSLKEFQGELTKNEAAVEYVFGDDALYALAISRNSATVTKIGRRDRVESLVRTFEGRLQGTNAITEAAHVASPVYQTLLSQLRPLAGKTRLIIVPDGSLHGLPFDIVASTGNSSSSTKPIVSLAPSATALFALKRKAAAATTADVAVLAVGDVPYDSFARKIPRPSRSAGVFDAKQKPDLPPLPASRAEVENAVAIFARGSVALLSTQATEAQFKKQSLDRFSIIHLAVHAFSDPKDQEHAALLLAPDKSGEEDGFLQPREISQLPITAKLVVLSACNTGMGPSFGQEGIANLARAFLIAGASSVVTTLWSVSDTSSKELMMEFYQNLHAGQDVAAALWNAKQILLKRFGPSILPTVAAFQVVGNAGVVIGPTPNSTAKGAKP
jgi:CHAT domain-containing protein/tetratricopeptide (TPR) repeat protein